MITYLFVALGALSMIAFLIFRDKKSSALAVCIKTITSIFFIITALCACLLNSNITKHPNNIVALLTIIGLVFGLFGDFTLDLKIYFKSLRDNYSNAMKDSDTMTYVGMGAFGVGHIVYITTLCLLYPSKLMYLGISCLVGIILSLLIVIVGAKLTGLNFGKWRIPSILYCFLLATFFAYSVCLLTVEVNTSNVLRLIGSIMFFVSDIILSITYFSEDYKYELKGLKNPEHRFFIISNHVTYYVAQFLIALSLLYLL